MGLNPFSSIFGKTDTYTSEYKKFKKAQAENPRDHGLRTQFIKFCLLNRFTNQDINEDHMAEALRLFETLDHVNNFDLQCHYLVGKYYQEDKDPKKAYQIYLNAIKHFNQYVASNPDHKSDNIELAYSIALNLLTLQSNTADPELKKCFKILRKSYPLHVKRIEFENEMAKPVPDTMKVKQLKEEIARLKEEEKKIFPSATKEKAAVTEPLKQEKAEAPKDSTAKEKTAQPSGQEKGQVPSAAKPADKTTPHSTSAGESKKAAHLDDPVEEISILAPDEGGDLDILKLSPIFEIFDTGAAFMVFQNDAWEGPFTLGQLKAMGQLKPGSWVCRLGTEQVTQAYEVPDLLLLFSSAGKD